jgi:V8-like Glu-specific endopeptidase
MGSSIKGFIMNFKTAIAASSLLSLNTQAVDWDAFSSSALIEVKRNSQVFTSSAVVIKRNVILTAAHSVENIDEGHIHLGHSFSTNNPKIKFKKVIIHQGYDKSKSNYKNDIAVVILESNLPETVRPVTLATNGPDLSEVVDRIGFGGREGKNLRTWTNPTIVAHHDDTLVLNDSLSVIGDSGGPIYHKQQLLGIHSTLEGQDRTYAVYVPNYVKWIYEQLPIREVEVRL